MTPEEIGGRRVGDGWFPEERLDCRRRLVEDDRRWVLALLEIDGRFDCSRIESAA